jgi:Cu+-exporting ATPase
MKQVVCAMPVDDANVGSRMEQDVVCGMQVDAGKAATASEYKGRMYHFCSAECKTKFDARPAAYAR